MDSGETGHKSASQMFTGTDTAAIFIGTQSDKNEVLKTPRPYGANLRLPHTFFQNSQDNDGDSQNKISCLWSVARKNYTL